MSRRARPTAGAGRADREFLEVRAPVRADLAGGTLDLWPLYCLHPGATTVTVALRRGPRLRLFPDGAQPGSMVFRTPGTAPLQLGRSNTPRHLVAAVGFHYRPHGGLVVEVLEQPPLGSGLGGSSALAVALARGCLTLSGRRVGPARLVAELRDLEAQVLAAPTGVQDYLAALHGGALAIHLDPGGAVTERLAVDLAWLQERLLIVYSGIAHASGMVNWEVYRARVDGEPRVGAALDAIAAAARACRAALLARDEVAVGQAIAAEWRARRTLAPAVNSPAIETLLRAGCRAGARAAKACGAGGGGSVLFWLPPERREAVRDAALRAVAPGAQEVGGGISRTGVRAAWGEERATRGTRLSARRRTATAKTR